MQRLRHNLSYTRSFILSAAIFIVALFVRLAPIGLYVTPDEPIWVHRSIQFLGAVETGDWTRVPRTGHPGVTTMALGALGVKITEVFRPTASAQHLAWINRLAWLAPENAPAFKQLSFFLPAGRILVAMTTSLGLVMVYLSGRPALGERAARWLALLLALDPFFAGHAGLLHTDALQATFVLLAGVLALPGMATASIPAGRRESHVHLTDLWRWGAVAFCLALAGLTKTLGLLAAPGLALALLVCGRGTWVQRFLRVAFVAALSVVVLLALTPTFFADPRGAVMALLQAVTYHEGIGLRDVFFAGEMRINPGPAFYPVVLAFRLTPPVLLGLLAVIFRQRRAPRLPWRVLVTAALPAAGYVIILTLATKKFDRYVLSAIPFLTLMAALPLAQLQRPWRRVMLALLLLPWAAVMIVPLHYATPLLGGPRGAESVVPLGWGEASGLAAGKLNQLLPSPQRASLLTKNVPGTASRFAGTTRAFDEGLVGCTDVIVSGGREMLPSYVLLDQVEVGGSQLASLYGAASVASGLVPAAGGLEALSDRPTLSSLPLVVPGPLPGFPTEAVIPVDSDFDTWLNARFEPGTEFLWVRAPACHPLMDAQLAAVFEGARAEGRLVCSPAELILGFESVRCEVRAELDAGPVVMGRFAGALDLEAASWDHPIDRADPLAVRLRLVPRVILGEVDVYLALRRGEGVVQTNWAEGGQRLVSDVTWPAPQWPVGETTDATAYLWIPGHLPPGNYDLVLMLSGAEGWLSLTYGDGAFGGIVLPLGEIELPGIETPAVPMALDPVPDPGWPGLRILGIAPLQKQLQAGRALRVAIGMERISASPPEELVWALTCEGQERQRGRFPWGPSDPTSWPVGARYNVVAALRVDPYVPEGPCRVTIRPAVGDPATPDDADSLVLSNVQITQRPRIYTLPQQPAVSLDVRVSTPGEGLVFAKLVGGDMGRDDIRPGELLDLRLYWRALAPATDDYTAFVHLVGPEGRIWAQSDQIPAGGQAPTVTWAAEEVIVDEHRLSVPTSLGPGTYTLYAGLYDAERGTRADLSVEGVPLEDDRVEVVTFSVAP